MPVTAFSDTWGEKPAEPIKIGLRTVAERDIQDARREAARIAWKSHPEQDDIEAREDAYNSALVLRALASSACQPEDASLPFWDAQESMLEVALTSEGLLHLWHELELLHAAETPLAREATDDEVARLAASLLDGSVMSGLNRADAARLRRHLGCILDLLPPTTPAD